MFSSPSLRRFGEGEYGRADVDAPGVRCEGDSSNRVGGRIRIALVITRTGLGWGMGNSARVDVAWLGAICSAVTKFRLKGTTPVTLKVARTVDSSKASVYAGAHTDMNSAFDTSRKVLASNATILDCQHDFILAKHTTSSP
jgi:hypothetical protein